MEGVGRTPEGGVDLYPLDIVEQRVKTRASEHPDLGRGHGRDPIS
jgi:hypothetical protein